MLDQLSISLAKPTKSFAVYYAALMVVCLCVYRLHGLYSSSFIYACSSPCPSMLVERVQRQHMPWPTEAMSHTYLHVEPREPLFGGLSHGDSDVVNTPCDNTSWIWCEENFSDFCPYLETFGLKSYTVGVHNLVRCFLNCGPVWKGLWSLFNLFSLGLIFHVQGIALCLFTFYFMDYVILWHGLHLLVKYSCVFW